MIVLDVGLWVGAPFTSSSAFPSAMRAVVHAQPCGLIHIRPFPILSANIRIGFSRPIDSQSLDLVFKGVKTVYTEAFLSAPVHKDKIAMTVPSTGRDETYGWLGQFPQLREWPGPRHVHNLKAHSFTIRNKIFESTVAVKRDEISDDKLGIFKPTFC